MQLKIKLRELGSSFGVILPKTLLELLDVRIGQFIDVKVGSGNFNMRKIIKIGASQGLIITRPEATDLGVRDGHYLDIKLDGKKLVISSNGSKQVK